MCGVGLDSQPSSFYIFNVRINFFIEEVTIAMIDISLNICHQSYIVIITWTKLTNDFVTSPQVLLNTNYFRINSIN